MKNNKYSIKEIVTDSLSFEAFRLSWGGCAMERMDERRVVGGPMHSLGITITMQIMLLNTISNSDVFC